MLFSTHFSADNSTHFFNSIIFSDEILKDDCILLSLLTAKDDANHSLIFIKKVN
jgi:hypothetical protein